MRRLAYLPLASFPDPVPNEAARRALHFAALLGAEVRAASFSIDVPDVSSPLGRLLLDVPDLIRASERRSRETCERLNEMLSAEASASAIALDCTIETAGMGQAGAAAAEQARYCDLSLIPFGTGPSSAGWRELAEGVVFGSGRPALLVPQEVAPESVDHFAVGWDGSRVAARALGDAIGLFGDGARITVMTVQQDKSLEDGGMAEKLADALGRRGMTARTATVRSGGRPVGALLQEHASVEGAKVLVMGAYGHTRMREFVLGGATRGVLSELRLPVLLSH